MKNHTTIIPIAPLRRDPVTNKGTSQGHPKLTVGSKRCQCVVCGYYFTNIRAFDLHIRGRRHLNPATLTNKSGAPILEDKGGYWGRAGSFTHDKPAAEVIENL